jgi:hypothetical protein
LGYLSISREPDVALSLRVSASPAFILGNLFVFGRLRTHEVRKWWRRDVSVCGLGTQVSASGFYDQLFVYPAFNPEFWKLDSTCPISDNDRAFGEEVTDVVVYVTNPSLDPPLQAVFESVLRRSSYRSVLTFTVFLKDSVDHHVDRRKDTDKRKWQMQM